MTGASSIPGTLIMRHRLTIESLENRRLLAVGPLALEPYVSGFSNPVAATHAGDGSGRLFVVEQSGLIHVVRDGERVGRPFLDLRSQTVDGNETGLLGLAFHPDYAMADASGEGKFYVYYSASSFVGSHDSVVAEFRVSTDDPDVADLLSQRTIMRFNQPFSNHNGGDLKFGPDDGLLYISSGDGGLGADPLGHGQNTNSLLGAILRIDVNEDAFPSDPLRNYAIPTSNPFVEDAESRDEIFAFGLRNPYRMSFDDGPDGIESPDRLFVGDVGQSTFEEVNLVTAGGNYGWSVCEGDHIFRDASRPCPDSFDAPIAEYGRSEGISVIGGYVYRGTRYPSLRGDYLFGDLNGTLMALQEEEDGSFVRSVPIIEGDEAAAIIGFGEDEAGELYALTFGQILSIRTPASRDVMVDAAGDVTVVAEGADVVVSGPSGEILRRPIESLNRLSINLSNEDDHLSLADFSEFELIIDVDGAGGFDTLSLMGTGHDVDLTAETFERRTDLESIDIRGDGANRLTLDLTEVISLSTSTDTLRVLHDVDDQVHYGEGWTALQPKLDNDTFLHQLAQDTAIVEVANSLSYQNPLETKDVNRSGTVSSQDALQVINALANRRGELNVPDSLADPFVYLDVSGDNVLSALDALQVINELGRRNSAEGEVVQLLRRCNDDTDDVFADDLWIERLGEQWVPAI